jgi:dCTP diphosphatase
MRDASTTLQQIKDLMREFVRQREWEQFHDLKNLSMAIAVEAGELMDHFRWVDNKAAAEVMRDEQQARGVRHELADVLVLLAEFAEVAGIDMAGAVAEKMEINRRKYPVDLARGSAVKRKEAGGGTSAG